MADAPSSPVNPFIVLCLLIVLGAGGFAVWKELSSDFSQADSAPLGEAAGTESDPLASPADLPPEGTVSTEPGPSEPLVPESSPPQPVAAPQSDPFPDAIARAEQAQNLSQLAQSQDDWRLVLNRWRQAIALMEGVPSSSPNYGQVAAKLADYRRNQAYAQSKVSQALPDNTVTGQVVVGGEPEADPVPTDGTEAGTEAANVTPTDGDNSPEAAASESSDVNTANTAARRVFSAPIVRRSGGTPVIQVLFNGRYTVEMIVDTGASGTVITQGVAQTLGVQPTGRTNVSTASAQNVSFLLGQVESIKVDGAVLNNVVVAIAGPGLDTGLLGHDFFGRYDVTVRSNVVEFQER